MTDTHNPATQAERKAVLENDNYHRRAQNQPDDVGGRYTKINSTTVTGATLTPQYPQLPASSPWAQGFDQNVEPALGFAIDEMPAAGTPVEVAQSLEAPVQPNED